MVRSIRIRSFYEVRSRRVLRRSIAELPSPPRDALRRSDRVVLLASQDPSQRDSNTRGLSCLVRGKEAD
jgi:hypothetical protein